MTNASINKLKELVKQTMRDEMLEDEVVDFFSFLHDHFCSNCGREHNRLNRCQCNNDD